MHPDLKDLLAAFAAHKVEYMVIGGYAVGFHAEPRFTKDLDLWLGDATANIESACAALAEFGAPEAILPQVIREWAPARRPLG